MLGGSSSERTIFCHIFLVQQTIMLSFLFSLNMSVLFSLLKVSQPSLARWTDIKIPLREKLVLLAVKLD